jgi:hypothetical protein
MTADACVVPYWHAGPVASFAAASGESAELRHRTWCFSAGLNGLHKFLGQFDLDFEARQRDEGGVITVVVAMVGDDLFWLRRPVRG